MRNYKNIKAWQLADQLALKVYSVTRRFPKEEIYGITSQLRRAAISVPTNIVEGASRNHKKEYLHFLYIARGSLAETEYLVSVAHRLEYVPEGNECEHLKNLISDVHSKLYGLIKSVKSEI